MSKDKDLWAQLEVAVAEGRTEAVHIIYDKIIHALAKQSHPKLVNKLDRLTKKVSFWYA